MSKINKGGIIMELPDPKLFGQLSVTYLAKMRELGNPVPDEITESLAYGLMEDLAGAKKSGLCSRCSAQTYLCDTPGSDHKKKCSICITCGDVIFFK
jgi:hypothetical protein